MISKNRIKAFSDNKYDYYELQQNLGGITPKGAIFVHDTDDTENGLIMEGCLKLCWTFDGTCYRGQKDIVGANTVIFHSCFKDTSMFKKAKSKNSYKIIDCINTLSQVLGKLKNLIEESK